MTPFEITRLQSKAWQVLLRSFISDRVAGAYLFQGREGMGRWAAAIAFTALLNCEQPIADEEDSKVKIPCGTCRNCRRILSLNFEGLAYAVPLPPHKSRDEAIDLTNEILQIKREEPFRILSSAASTHIPIAVAREIKKNLSYRAAEGIKRVVLF